jgi:hypothetical protein
MLDGSFVFLQLVEEPSCFVFRCLTPVCREVESNEEQRLRKQQLNYTQAHAKAGIMHSAAATRLALLTAQAPQRCAAAAAAGQNSCTQALPLAHLLTSQ